MKLSEAIRLGSMLRPQTFGTTFDGHGTCANGAALDAVGKLNACNVKIPFPIAETEVLDCHVCGFRLAGLVIAMAPTLGGAIAHLNDDHRWTREQIADWVETLEARSTEPKTDDCGLRGDPAAEDPISVGSATKTSALSSSVLPAPASGAQ